MAETYALDDAGNLVRGGGLTFAYSGAGVATLIDAAGTGFKVAVGTKNLKAIEGDSLVLEPDEGPVVESEPGTYPYGDLTKKELLALCQELGIEVQGRPNNGTLIGLLVAAEEQVV